MNSDQLPVTSYQLSLTYDLRLTTYDLQLPITTPLLDKIKTGNLQ
jgi:hypothetical protein